MKNQLLKLAFEVEIEEGEQLTLPSSIVQGIGKGKWVITIQPKTLVQRSPSLFLSEQLRSRR
jgi:hypothetical protein